MKKNKNIPKALSKKDIKEVVIEALEPSGKAVQKDFQKIDTRFDKVDARFDKVEQDVKLIKYDIKFIKEDVEIVKQDVKWMKENSSELFTKLDKLIKLYEDQKQELLIFGAQIKRLEERVNKLEAKQV